MKLRSDVTSYLSRIPASSDDSYTISSILNLSSVSVRCLTNDEIEEFAVNGPDDKFAVKYNDYYPGVTP